MLSWLVTITSVKWHHMEKIIWSSEYRSMADAWELRGEEGRDKLRKATGRSKYPVIRGLPNGVTHRERFLYCDS